MTVIPNDSIITLRAYSDNNTSAWFLYDTELTYDYNYTGYNSNLPLNSNFFRLRISNCGESPNIRYGQTVKIQRQYNGQYLGRQWTHEYEWYDPTSYLTCHQGGNVPITFVISKGNNNPNVEVSINDKISLRQIKENQYIDVFQIGKSDGTIDIPGCTDSTDSNYNPLANTDDGTCIIPGCTDPNSSNYNPLSKTDDGTCSGCTDMTATNYNALAITDDGTCIIPGCTNSLASNYNLSAKTDDGTCEGCTDPVASNYTDNVIEDKSSCQYSAADSTREQLEVGIDYTFYLTPDVSSGEYYFASTEDHPFDWKDDLSLGILNPVDRALACSDETGNVRCPLPTKYIIKFFKKECQYREGDGSKLYYGDFVQIANVDNYYLQCDGGTRCVFINDATDSSGLCEGHNRTFQILSSNSADKLKGNEPVYLNDYDIVLRKVETNQVLSFSLTGVNLKRDFSLDSIQNLDSKYMAGGIMNRIGSQNHSIENFNGIEHFGESNIPISNSILKILENDGWEDGMILVESNIPQSSVPVQSNIPKSSVPVQSVKSTLNVKEKTKKGKNPTITIIIISLILFLLFISFIIFKYKIQNKYKIKK